MIHPQIGDTQGKLTITGNHACTKDSRNYTVWSYEVKCCCGKTYFMSRVNWKAGVSSCRSCRKWPEKTQPLYGTRIYVIWANMLARCYTQSNKAYRFYGNRGIAVCKDWHDVGNFNTWALANGYTDKLTIDRIDPDKNYEPENCRWIPHDLNIRRRKRVATYPHSEIFSSALVAAKHFKCHDQHIRLLCRSSLTYDNRWFYYINEN